VKDHQRWRELKGHELIKLGKKDNEGSNNTSSLKIKHKPPICPVHTDETMKFYCIQDEMLVCRDCLVTTHEGHKRDRIELVATTEKDKLDETTPKISEAIAKLDDAILKGGAMKNQVEGSRKEAVSEIEKMSRELIEAIEARKRILLKRCEDIAGGKQEVLSSQIEDFKKVKKRVSFLQEQAIDAITNHTAEELLSVKKTVADCIQKEMDNFDRLLLDLQEDHWINTLLDTNSLKEQIGGLGHFPSVPEPMNCSIEGICIPEAVVGKERKFKIILKDEKNQPLKGDALFQYSLVNKDVEDAPLLPQVAIIQSEDKDGTATLSIIPNTPGRYELSVMVRHTALAKCPFSVTVVEGRDYKALPADPQLVINVDRSQTRGIAIHPVNGTIYASDYSGNTVLVRLPDGTPGNPIGSNDNAGGNLQGPCGVAIVDYVLYVVSYSTHSVKKYNINTGEFISEFGKEEEPLSNPLGICYDNNGHILVADQSNSRIKIYTSADDKLMKSIPCTHYPYDVAVDVDGNIHAAIYQSNYIQVFHHDHCESDNDYKKVTIYNAGGSMRTPTGITIDAEGYRMVTEANHNVMRIIDLEGAVIATHAGLLFGIARDKDGFIYVADVNNPHIRKY
jgi:DNA-binding beta-propeller fold protein YncE